MVLTAWVLRLGLIDYLDIFIGQSEAFLPFSIMISAFFLELTSGKAILAYGVCDRIFIAFPV